MKVLFIFHTSILDGGASRSGLNLVKGLSEKGIEIHTIISKDGPLKDELLKLGMTVDIVPFKWAYPRYFGNLKSVVKFVPSLLIDSITNSKAVMTIVAIAERYRVDFIHSNTSVIDVGFKAACRLGLPHITHNREFGYKDCTAVMWHIRKQLEKSDSYSISITKCIHAFRDLNNSTKHPVIYNGMYPASSKIFNDKKDPYILYVGALNRQKGLLDLLEGYGILLSLEGQVPMLRIAGDTSRISPALKKECEYMCCKYDITDKVEWLGKCEDVHSLMSKALCIVVPSLNEAFGRVMAEAMFNGCLVIGRNTAGLKEQFDNGVEMTGGEIGLRFDNTKDLAEQMRIVITRPIEEFYPMIHRAQKCVVDLYSNESYVNRTAEFYKIVTQDNGINYFNG